MSQLWCEKYKPITIQDCILPENIKNQFEMIIERESIPNMLLYGNSGVGKTSTARVLCEQLDIDWIIINISEESGIDTLRTKLRDFASSVSITNNGKKCVILDEFDYASQNLQAGLRAFIEEFSSVCSFVMTCNHEKRVSKALHSRTVAIDFSYSINEEKQLKKQLLDRLKFIIKEETDKKINVKDLNTIINNFFPDNRKIINETQQFIENNKMPEKVQEADLQKADSIKSIIEHMSKKDYDKIMHWCKENKDINFKNVYTILYNSMSQYLDKKSMPDAILLLEEYQRYHLNSLNKEIHICALFTKMANNLKFKPE